MYTSLFASVFLAFVAAQSSSDNSPLTTITLAASAILPPASTSSANLATITNTNAPVTTITLASGAILPSSSSVAAGNVVGAVAASSSIKVTTIVASSSVYVEPTVYSTSVITSTICGACATTSAAAIGAAAVTVKPSSYTTLTRNATISASPNVLPHVTATAQLNGTVAFTGAADSLSAGSLALTAGVLAASYFAFAL